MIISQLFSYFKNYLSTFGLKLLKEIGIILLGIAFIYFAYKGFMDTIRHARIYNAKEIIKQVQSGEIKDDELIKMLPQVDSSVIKQEVVVEKQQKEVSLNDYQIKKNRLKNEKGIVIKPSPTDTSGASRLLSKWLNR